MAAAEAEYVKGRAMSTKILILEGITDKGLEILKAEGWTLDMKKAMPPAELAKIIGSYEAMTIRSSTQVTAEVIDAAKRLRVIGRPGRRGRQRGPGRRHPRAASS